ncbi:MAG: PaaI family thioesterase [Chitinophagales bacterium]|nr:PaaI family thioesterase [Chitinophagales bacterium]
MSNNPRVQLFKSVIGNTIWQDKYPIIKLLNGEVLAVEEGHLTIQFTITKNLLNPNGILHGGIMSTMLDELMGAALFTMNNENPFATINLNVDFLSAARENDIIIGIGEVVKNGKTVANTKAKLLLNNKVIAKGTSNLVRMPNKV